MGEPSSQRHTRSKRTKTRPLFIKVRVSEQEKIHFESLASGSGVTLSDFIRKRLAGVRIYPVHIALERNRQLARIGNNINQLARWANTQKSGLDAVKVISALEGFLQEIRGFAATEPRENADAG